MFINDINIKVDELKDKAKVMLGVWRCVLNHVKQLKEILVCMGDAKFTMSGKKSHFGGVELDIVGQICNATGRRPEEIKIKIIVKSDRCHNVTEVRRFFGMMGFYCNEICAYSIIAAPLYDITRKGVIYEWGQVQREAMATL